MPPPLPMSRQASARLTSSAGYSAGTSHAQMEKATEIELFVDLCCPFCNKMWQTLFPGWKLENFLFHNDNDVRLVVQANPQPWHPQSAILFEVCFAFKALFGDMGFLYAYSLLKQNGKTLFYDVPSYSKSRKTLYEEAIDVVLQCKGECPSEEVQKAIAGAVLGFFHQKREKTVFRARTCNIPKIPGKKNEIPASPSAKSFLMLNPPNSP